MDGRRGPVPKVRSETLNSVQERSLILQDPIRPPLVRRVFSAVSPSVLSLIGDDLVANGDRMMIDVAVWKGGADRRKDRARVCGGGYSWMEGIQKGKDGSWFSQNADLNVDKWIGYGRVNE